jgi:hypothetical protein
MRNQVIILNCLLLFSQLPPVLSQAPPATAPQTTEPEPAQSKKPISGAFVAVVEMHSIPDGASIYVDDDFVGKTPVNLEL